MRRTILTSCVVGLMVSGSPCVFAQRSAPPRIEDFADMLDMVIPPIAPILPIPPLPPLPPLPAFEGFHFEYGEQDVTSTTNPELRLQEEVFRTLVRNNPERALELAAERLKADPKDPVVLSNLSAIANSGAGQAMPLLISIAKTSPDIDARRVAVSAIGRTRTDRNGLAVLEEIYATNSDNVEVRRAVVASVGRSSDVRAVSVLANIVKNDHDESVRRAAVQQLGSRKEAEALKALEDILREPPKNRG